MKKNYALIINDGIEAFYPNVELTEKFKALKLSEGYSIVEFPSAIADDLSLLKYNPASKKIQIDPAKQAAKNLDNQRPKRDDILLALLNADDAALNQYRDFFSANPDKKPK